MTSTQLTRNTTCGIEAAPRLPGRTPGRGCAACVCADNLYTARFRRGFSATIVVVTLALLTAVPASAMSRPPRAAITALLDRFIPDVLVGRDLRVGKTLVGGYITVDTVQRYPAKGHDFHGWLLDYAQPRDVGFDILLQPTKKSLGAWSFRGEAQKIHGTWKIVDWYPVAELQPPGKPARVNGPADLAPATLPGPGPFTHTGWLWMPVGIVAFGLLTALGFGVRAWLRRRRRIRGIERTLATNREIDRRASPASRQPDVTS